MKSFDVHIPTRLLFGPEQGQKFVRHVCSLGKRVFIGIGGGTIERLGYLQPVTELFDQQKTDWTVFRGIEPNPHAETIDRAANEARAFGADVFLAFGGGSVMDATKCISALAKTGNPNIWPFVLGGEKQGQLKDAFPIAAIPTTAATASEVTPYSVVSHPPVNGKAPIGHQAFKPLVSWLNPAFTTGLTPTTTRDGAADIMSHVFENYILGGNDSPLADRYSEAILDTVMNVLPRIISDPDNLGYRGQMLWASSLALNGLQQAGRQPGEFVMHAMEHALSGFYPDLAHGRGLATLFPSYFRWMITHGRAVDRFALLGERLFGISNLDEKEKALKFVELFENWLKENSLSQKLPDLSIDPARYEEIAEYTVNIYGRESHLYALGKIQKEDIVEIFGM